MKLVGYTRVSTDRQADGYGLDVQQETIKAWAKANGHRLVRVLTDEAVSGAKDLGDRPALLEAFETIKAGQAGGLVVPRLDRLARDLILQEQLLAEVRRGGGQVFSAADGEAGYLADDPDDPSRRLIRQVLGAVAEYERSMIALRLRSGRRRKHEQGGFAYGSPPLGYRSVGGQLVKDDAEQDALSRIRVLVTEREWARAKGQPGMSLREMCRDLEERGYKTKRGSASWQPTTVARAIAQIGART